ncbi:hypothetical protein EOD39_2540 [Acipenser ruthenus]|uniref:Nuclease HARBI1 n=1 Tax=Acipenser ruthenus TaxID=7906 RepID=A0A444U0D2_ACIRT|nr:hypothetical protein EOD39_2540 [Acipenser ruthenus]
MQIDIGAGILIPEASPRYCDHSQYSKLTSSLLMLVCTKEELAQSRISSKSCNIHKKDLKKQLEHRKVEAIVCFPGVIGAVDGIHIRIIAPVRDEPVYGNRKMAAVVHFLMWRHLALVEERQEHVQRRRARQRRPCIFNPRVTLFGMSEDAVLKRYRLTLQVKA